MTETKPELQQQLQDALGLSDDDFAYHATDLYVLDKPGVRAWLKANYHWHSNITSFVGAKGSSWEGKPCLDIPFAGHWGLMPKVLVVCELDTTNLPPFDDLREPGCMQNLRDFFASTLYAAHENKTNALSRGDSESVKQYDYDIALAKRFLQSLRIFNIFDQQSEAIEFEQVLEIALELFPELTKAQCEEVIWMNTTYPFRTDDSIIAKTELFRQQLKKIREHFDAHNKFPNGILI